VHPGHRVLDIGIGTGYTAALLAQRLGTGHVTSIEIAPDVAVQARTALAATGYGEICVITGNGALGYPPHAPYDRIVSTAAVSRIPS
jgi:protein-L-isoaspartate(D-aspartate) O-methyltransferase